MNNFTFVENHPAANETSFTYYETIAGGCGASSAADGPSASHSHMTNSWNTPTEGLEATYPVRVKRYSIRRNSGGAGKHRGGVGIVREIEVLSPGVAGVL